MKLLQTQILPLNLISFKLKYVHDYSNVRFLSEIGKPFYFVESYKAKNYDDIVKYSYLKTEKQVLKALVKFI